jgi:HK97 family phage portal protein
LNFLKQVVRKSLGNSRFIEDRFYGTYGQDIFDSTTFKNSTDYMNAYQNIAYVGNAVAIISKDVAQLDFKFVEYRNKQEQEIEVPEMRTFFNHPNNQMDYYQFVFYVMAHVLLDGNAFLLKDTTNALALVKNTFNEMIPLNPSLVDVYDTNGKIITANYHSSLITPSYYRVNIGEQHYDVPAEYIIQAEMPNPLNAIRGMGTVQTNANTLDADKFISIFNKAYFHKGVKSNLIVEPTSPMGDKEYSRLKDQLRGEMQGFENFEQMLIMPPKTKATPVKLTYDEFQFIEQKKFTRQDIYGVFKIPPIVSGLMEDSNYDSVFEQKRVYHQDTIPGYFKILELAFSSCIRQKTGKEIFFRFIPKEVTDKELMADIGQKLFDRGAITPNEYAKMVGQEGDSNNSAMNLHYIPMNYIPLDDAQLQTESSESEKKNFNVADEKAKRANRKQWRIHWTGLKSRKGLEPKTYKDVRKYYEGMEERAIANFNKNAKKDYEIKKVTGDNIIDWESEKKIAKESAKKFHTSIIVTGLKDFNDILDAGIDTTFKNKKIKLTVEKLGIKYANETIDSRRKELKAIISKAVEEGVPISETKGRIHDYFGTLNATDRKQGWRTDRIARTEVSTAYDQAAKISYEELDVKKVQVIGCEKQWEGWDCDTDGTRGEYSVGDMDGLSFHPNHAGSIVPVIK